MKFEWYYPDWKEMAVTFSYDDGQIFDRRLVEIFNRYDLKATFHLNSGRLGADDIFIRKEEVKELYQGHEVACHGVDHEYPTHLPREVLLHEFLDDRLCLEKLTGGFVRGCSYAFGDYNDDVIRTLKSIGIVYSRTVESTGGFGIPRDFMRWTPTCHHNDAFQGLAQRFLDKPFYEKHPLLYVWGHSFEFEGQNTWEQMEQFCSEISRDPRVWYATNYDIYEYVTAVRRLVFTADGSQVKNPSAVKIYASLDGEKCIL